MDELIALLEKATVPDRELNAALNCIRKGWSVEMRNGKAFSFFHHADDKEAKWHYLFDTRGRIDVAIGYPSYTASIDAAVTLVPEGWAWFVERIDGFTNGDARLWLPAQRARGYIQENFDVRKAANPAIAICIAALRARQAIAKTPLKSQENV